jgi:hypothetical protein
MVAMPGFGNLSRLTITSQLPPKKVSVSPWRWMMLDDAGCLWATNRDTGYNWE